MSVPQEVWEILKKSYRVSAAKAVAQHAASLLLERHSNYFRVDTKTDSEFTRFHFVEFVITITLAASEAKALGESPEEFVDRLQRVLMAQRAHQPDLKTV